MNIVTDNTDLIVMTSDGYPTPPDGGKLYELTEVQEAERKAAFAQPNSGVLFDGTTFILVPPVVVTPRATCSAMQFQLELDAQNLTAQVDALVSASSKQAQIAFRYATSFDSDNPLLVSLAAQLTPPLTATEVYQLILSASKITVGVPATLPMA